MTHIVLAGDSIFDNAVYVDKEKSVIELLSSILPNNTEATLIAVDGSITNNVSNQLQKLSQNATHLFISCGGNDALGIKNMLQEPSQSMAHSLERLTQIRHAFSAKYQSMLHQAKKLVDNVVVCTIHDSVPDFDPRAITALALFNEVILREAVSFGIPVMDLRITCNEPGDYSSISPIEPSEQGGRKIANLILSIVTTHDFSNNQSTIYT